MLICQLSGNGNHTKYSTPKKRKKKEKMTFAEHWYIKEYRNVRRTGKRCVWVLLENRGEMERFDWSDFFAVLAVTYGKRSFRQIDRD